MSKPETTPHPTPGESLSRHRSVWEARADGWIGMVDDLGRLADMSRDHADWEPCGARVRQLAQGLAPGEGQDGLRLALHGGEDYELLFTAAPWQRDAVLAAAHSAGVATCGIGRIEAGDVLRVVDAEGRMLDHRARGFDHFAP